jgi:hypothetical protein
MGGPKSEAISRVFLRIGESLSAVPNADFDKADNRIAVVASGVRRDKRVLVEGEGKYIDRGAYPGTAAAIGDTTIRHHVALPLHPEKGRPLGR